MRVKIRRQARRLVRQLFGACARFAARLSPPRSPWERIAMRVPAVAFGPGSRRRFTHYLEGDSDVRLASIDEIVAWLLACEYARDADLFHEPDVWQHPGEFERLRRGDCEDFALWTWRKLTEIGIEAEFYVGRVRRHEEIDGRQHAWVVYRAGGNDFLFEPAARSHQEMIRRLADAMHDYVPHFAVNHRSRTSAFGGYVLDARVRDRRPRDPQAQIPQEIKIWRG